MIRKRHDEDSDVRSLAKIAKLEYGAHGYARNILIPKNAVIGIRRWGRIDYLVNHCFYHIIWTESKSNLTVQTGDKTSARAAKKAAKEPKLSDKTKKKK